MLVRLRQIGHSRGILAWHDRVVACTLGRGGVRADKCEGDGATPAGRFAFRRVLWRADRLAAPISGLPCTAIAADDGWCDWPADPLYNQPIKLPYAARHERLWRMDALYDLVVILGHNDDPVVPEAGSAVFMHLARTDFGATDGCIGLALEELRELLTALDPASAIAISPR